MSGVDLDRVALRFRRFADTECGRLPLYRRLCLATAEDPDLLALVARARPRQWRPNLLLAAVHDLLLAGADHPLGAWYPTVAPGPPPSGDPVEAFRDFIETHRDAVAARLREGATQTNEVNRCWLWRLGIAVCVPTGVPVGLIELGASAGLNLALDRFGYELDGERLDDGPLVLSTRTVGARAPVGAMPRVAARSGIDLEPVALGDPDAVRWLKACIWPEQPERHRRFDAAVEIARHDPPPVVAGDLVDDVVDAVERLPHEFSPVVVNSWVLTYLEPDRRGALVERLDALGAARDLTWLSAEAPGVHPGVPAAASGPLTPGDTTATVLVARTWRSGRVDERVLARSHPHLDWLEWLGPTEPSWVSHPR